METGRQPDQRGPILFLVLLVLVGLIVVAWGVGREEPDRPGDRPPRPDPAPEAPLPGFSAPPLGEPEQPSVEPEVSRDTTPRADRRTLPGGGRRVFGGHGFLVAYYGTARTPALGVLGESPPDTMDRRLRRAAAPFGRPGRPVRHVYELIVTIADRHPGPDGDYSHDVARVEVERYIRAAHRNDALLVLDIQPGRSTFTEVAKRWAWALEDPWVGLALDPEWRMGPAQVPGRTIGHVRAGEVNRTTAWLARMVHRLDLPEKLFVLHQFRASMVEGIGEVRRRPGLATVQHVDGFGTRAQKLATYDAVARPGRFTTGFKLFYDEDVRRMSAGAVHAVRPPVRFVSFQ